MQAIDNDEEMRILAHQIWEREGRPNGREHEHWAEAAEQIASRRALDRRVPVPAPDLTADSEVTRLRRALYEPGVFSFELFGAEIPASPFRAQRRKANLIAAERSSGASATPQRHRSSA